MSANHLAFYLTLDSCTCKMCLWLDFLPFADWFLPSMLWISLSCLVVTHFGSTGNSGQHIHLNFSEIACLGKSMSYKTINSMAEKVYVVRHGVVCSSSKPCSCMRWKAVLVWR